MFKVLVGFGNLWKVEVVLFSFTTEFPAFLDNTTKG